MCRRCPSTMGWYSPGPELGCLGTTHLLPCHEATSAPTPPSCVYPASLRIHTQPGCPPNVRPSPPPPCPAPTRCLKPLAPIANNLCCLDNNTTKRKRLQPSAKTKDSAALQAAWVSPALLRVCFCFLFQTDIEKEKKNTKLPSVLEDLDRQMGTRPRGPQRTLPEVTEVMA